MASAADSARQRREEMLRKAHEAEVKAKDTPDPYLQSNWQTIADGWRQLADQIARTFKL